MASGSFTVSTSNSNVDGKVTWSSTENEAANTSNVTCEMRLWRSNTGYTTYGTGDFYITINGTRVDANNKSFTLTYNSNTLIMTATVNNITHNTDGKKTITIAWGGSSNVFSVNSGSGSAVLDNIPRASTMSSSASWTAGTNLSVAISRASSSFVHSVYVNVNGVQVGYAGNVGTSTTMTLDHEEIFNQINTSSSQDTSITLVTYASAGGSEVGRKTYTGTCTAPSASTTSAPASFNIGSSFTIPITRANTGFTHTVRLKNGSTILKTYTSQGTSTSFDTSDIASTLYSASASSKTLALTIETITYYGAEQVRTPTTESITANVTNSEPTFSTISYLDTSSRTSLTGNNQYIIQNYSSLRAQVLNANKAVAKNSATITKYIATVAGKSLTANSPFGTDINFDFGAINANVNQTLTITAYDSRGYEVSVTKTVNMVPYAPPVVTASATRQDGFLDSTTITLKGSISPLNVAGVNKNSLVSPSMTWKTRVKNGTWGGTTIWLGQTLTMPNYTTTNVVTNLANTSAWEIQINVTDQITSTTPTLEVGTGQPVMFLDDVKKSVGIGKLPVNSGRLETQSHANIGGDLYVTGNIDLGGSGAFIASNAGTSNIDHIWHDDNGNIWHFVSDGTYQREGNSVIMAGRGEFKATSSVPLRLYTTSGSANYMEFYNSGATSRTGYIGHSSSADNDIVIYNQQDPAANIQFYPGDGECYIAGDKIEAVVTDTSNANGRYIRFKSGWQICTVNGTTNMSVSSAYGSLYQNSVRWTFPAAFAFDPGVAVGRVLWGTGASWGTLASHTTTYADLRCVDAFNRASGSTTFNAIAIGRWK